MVQNVYEITLKKHLESVPHKKTTPCEKPKNLRVEKYT